LGNHDVVFSDGEHIGIPLSFAMRFGSARPHVVIGHRLTTPRKRPLFKVLKAHARMTRIIVHSRHQLEAAATLLGIPRDRLELIPYGADTRFWTPLGLAEEPLIVAAGREHRDYALLDEACAGLGQRLLITASSTHSPDAICTMPPSDSTAVVAQLDYSSLRDAYARAAVVVVPLLRNDFQAGVTAVLEAMAMQKAVVVSATDGLRDVVVDGETAMLVPPSDVMSMRNALKRLLEDPRERERLGRNARRAVEERFSLDQYVEALAASLQAATENRTRPAELRTV
jgi:glycosyltransferase involved in cell wall biosynthesis